MNFASKNGMNSSEFVHLAVTEKMQTDKLNDSQTQFVNLFNLAFKTSYNEFHKQIMVVLNRTEFNTKWILKQNDIFMQHLKIPQTKAGLSFTSIGHPITEKAEELVLKDLHKMAKRKREIDEQE